MELAEDGYLAMLQRLRESIDELEGEIDGIADFVRNREPGASGQLDREIVAIQLADAESRLRAMRDRLG